MNHIMIDLETFGTGELPMIVSIGWAVFDEDKILGSGVMHPVLEGNIDSDTVMFWLKQDDDARSKIYDVTRGASLTHCLLELAGFIDESDITGVWANGVSFDLRILKEWYEIKNILVPWKYYSERCMRSFKELDVPRISPGVAHCAESDAIAQAKTVQNVWRKYAT